MIIHPFIKLDDRLANGRGMTDCELIGISGNCGYTCFVLLAGKCETNGEMIEGLINALQVAEQTLRNLGNGELTGDAKIITLNAATRIRRMLDE